MNLRLDYKTMFDHFLRLNGEFKFTMNSHQISKKDVLKLRAYYRNNGWKAAVFVEKIDAMNLTNLDEEFLFICVQKGGNER
jgi:hypothetical protein